MSGRGTAVKNESPVSHPAKKELTEPICDSLGISQMTVYHTSGPITLRGELPEVSIVEQLTADTYERFNTDEILGLYLVLNGKAAITWAANIGPKARHSLIANTVQEDFHTLMATLYPDDSEYRQMVTEFMAAYQGLGGMARALDAEHSATLGVLPFIARCVNDAKDSYNDPAAAARMDAFVSKWIPFPSGQSGAAD